MTVYTADNPKRSWYGEAIGILILDAAYPCIPGNVGNATTFDFPVRYKVVKNASIERLLTQRDPSLLDPFLTAARDLQDEGVRAITGACGFMALFQPQIQKAVDIPVFISSLLQIPFIHQILPPGKKIGVITANASVLTPEHFINVGVSEKIPLVVRGMEQQTEFRESVLEEKGSLDSVKVEKEVLDVASAMIAEHPDVYAILLECSDLPPYAEAIFKGTGRPVFDFITMIRYVHSALTPRPYNGFM